MFVVAAKTCGRLLAPMTEPGPCLVFPSASASTPAAVDWKTEVGARDGTQMLGSPIPTDAG